MQSITIPDYPDSIQMAKARRPVYYTKKGKRKIPKRYLNKEKYGFNVAGQVINLATGERVIANSKTAGTERRWVVNFQEIWNGNTSGAARAAKVNKLKDILRPYIQQLKPIRPDQYPIGMAIKLYNTEFKVDASNKGVIYIKVIEDLMTELKIIEDDGPGYINDTGRILLIKVNSEKERKMKVIIFKSYTEYDHDDDDN